MILAIDIGNTNITVGGYENEKLKFISRLATNEQQTEDQYAVELYNIMRLYGAFSNGVDGGIISSVVPSVGDSMYRAVNKLLGITPLVVGPGVKTGVNIKIDNPSQLGADLVVGAVGAMSKYPMPCIIIDMGTATTLSVMDKSGAFIGGAIAAGVGLTLNALTKNTTLLPSVSIEAPKNVIGSNTIDCMKSGIVMGTAAMLDGMLDRIENELGEKCFVVATGGRSQEIVKHCNRDIKLDENLLLDGLLNIYLKNSLKIKNK